MRIRVSIELDICETPVELSAVRVAAETKRLLRRYNSGRYPFATEQVQAGLRSLVERGVYDAMWNHTAEQQHERQNAFVVATPAAEAAAARISVHVDVEDAEVTVLDAE